MSEYIEGYEDSYNAEVYDNFEEFWDNCEVYWVEGSLVGYMNFPAWADLEEGTLSLGLFMQRKGIASIWVTPCTDEQYRQVQDAISQVWIGKIDAGFPRRYSSRRG